MNGKKNTSVFTFEKLYAKFHSVFFVGLPIKILNFMFTVHNLIQFLTTEKFLATEFFEKSYKKECVFNILRILFLKATLKSTFHV